ncbi:hypothetical protein LguiB_009443 [Lonicera macranthoides]
MQQGANFPNRKTMAIRRTTVNSPARTLHVDLRFAVVIKLWLPHKEVEKQPCKMKRWQMIDVQ